MEASISGHTTIFSFYREVKTTDTVDPAEGINFRKPLGTADLDKHLADGKVSHGPVHTVWLCQEGPQLVMC